jgi:type 1 glutamine amidotransferase
MKRNSIRTLHALSGVTLLTVCFGGALLLSQAPPPAAPPTGQSPAGGRGAQGQGGAGRGTPGQVPGRSGVGGGGPVSSRSPLKKRVLVIGAAEGFHHDSIPDAMAAIYSMGKESGIWETELRTDFDLIAARGGRATAVGFQPQGLNDFDAVVFTSATGEFALDDQQRKDLLAYVHDQGRGFVGIHGALDSNYDWPEYGELIGGYFGGHPFNTVQSPLFDFPIVVEDPAFPAVQHFPKAFYKQDEVYVPCSTAGARCQRIWSREGVNVLLRLDESKLDFTGKTAPLGNDVAVAWSKMYGRGRVFYSSLGHPRESWDDPDIRKMYLEAIKWVLGRTEGSTTSHPKPSR